MSRHFVQHIALCYTMLYDCISLPHAMHLGGLLAGLHLYTSKEGSIVR